LPFIINKNNSETWQKWVQTAKGLPKQLEPEMTAAQIHKMQTVTNN